MTVKKFTPIEYCPDFIMQSCDNRHNCHYLCYPLTWINGHVPLKEPLANDILPKNYEVTKIIMTSCRRHRVTQKRF